ncbi:MAG: hypothetical protein KA817_07120 [Flavobacteriales bacterium]|nr:hypothetical protein [Flavobacteriales bacterium]
MEHDEPVLNPNVTMLLKMILAVMIGSAPAVVIAQCSIASYAIVSNCGQVGPQANVTLSGGAPPYQLTFTGSNGVVSNAQSFQNGPMNTYLPTFPVFMEPPVALQVTDAQGCVANSSAFFFIHMVCTPEVWLEYSCGGAAQLYWSGTFNMAGSPGWSSPCGFSDYMVSGLQGFNQSGSLAGGWTQITPSIWRFNTPLPLGTNYSVWIWPAAAPNGCLSGNLVYCYSAGGATAESNPTECGTRFRLQAALSGALPSGSIMTDGLRTANLIPLTEPYSALGYTYVGQPANLSIPASALTTTGNNAIVDWVVVEMRADGAAGTVLYSEPALLQRDGDVVDTDGNGQWLRTPVLGARYHVALRHRNHLGIMTASAYWLGGSPYSGIPNTMNLRAASLASYGTDARKAVGSVQCLWAGDATGNGALKYTGAGNDRDPILIAVGSTTPNNTVNNVYDRRDTNLDGVIKYTGTANDRDIILTNVGSTTPNSTRTQQLP